MQYTQIKKIVIYIGAAACANGIQSFCSHQAKELAELGFFYPIKNYPWYGLGVTHAEFRNDTPPQPVFSNEVERFHTIILSCPQYYRLPEKLSTYTTLLQPSFPQASIFWYLALPQLDISLEDRFYLPLYHQTDNTRVFLSRLYEQFPHDYGRAYCALTTHLTRTHINLELSGLTGGDTTKVHQSFLEYAGVPHCIFKDNHPTQQHFFYGRDITTFKMMISGLGNDFLNLPWHTQIDFFTHGQDKHFFFSPEKRYALRKRYEHSTAAFLQQHKKQYVFGEIGDGNWTPFTALHKDDIYHLVRTLTPDFRTQLWKKIKEIPMYMLTIEQRYCYNALAENHTSPAIPLPATFSNSTKPKLSVLTLTYNHGDFIEDTIRSVIDQQTDFPIQHIIADDASTDKTQEIILDYAGKYPHIVPIFQMKNLHGVKNVAALFGMARTHYVALCDGDDYFTDPLKLQKQVDFLEENPTCALCFHPVQVVYEDGTNRSRVYPPLEALPRGIKPFYYLADLLRVNLIQTNSVVYRWRFTNGIPHWFRTDLLPADWYWHLLHAELGKIGFIPDVMSVYRRHKKSIYYSAEVNPQFHRHKTGLAELRTYEAINNHFEGKYFSELCKLSNGVFADKLLYANQTDDMSTFDLMVEQYPEFAKHFLQSLIRVTKAISG